MGERLEVFFVSTSSGWYLPLATLKNSIFYINQNSPNTILHPSSKSADTIESFA